ncbi:MAG TPA: hypothetical protein VF490_05345 [Chryseosolibacter sp.]
MRKSIHFREITLAIGIVVALLIALTLWSTGPAAGILSGDGSSGATGSLPAAKELLHTAVSLFPFGFDGVQ